MNMEKKQLIGVAVLAAILVLGYFGWQMWGGAASDARGLFTPEPANPFEESANPYENIKTNPFE